MLCLARVVLLLVSLGSPAVVSAVEAAVTASPGDLSAITRIEARCPTFSWGGVTGAQSYDLVVYSLVDDTDRSEPLLRESIHGSVHSWTPALDRCLDPGGQYAWSVRAVRGTSVGEWSDPRLFEVSEGDVIEALAVLRRFLERGESLEAIDDVVELLRARRPGGASGSSVPPSQDRFSLGIDRQETLPHRGEISGPDENGGRASTATTSSISEIGLSSKIAALNFSQQANVAAVRGDFDSSDNFDRAIGYLGVSTPAGSNFDGFGQLDFINGDNVGVLGFTPPTTSQSWSVVGVAGGSNAAGLFYNADSSGAKNTEVILGDDNLAVRVEGDNIFLGNSFFSPGLTIPVFVPTYTSSTDASPEVYQILDASVPTCERGRVAVMRASGAGSQDSLCFCGSFSGNLQWWCFNP